MELNEFRTETLDDVHVNVKLNRTFAREEFFVLYANTLVEAGEFEDYEQLAFEGVGPRKKRIQIDGYNYSALEECLNIFIAPFSDSIKTESLTASDAENYFKWARTFVEESFSGYIQKNAEESSPGYGLAVDIKTKYNSVRKIKIYLLTDMIMSNRIREIPSTTLGEAVVEYHIWDIARLQALIESKTGKEDIVINLKEFSEHGIPCLEAGENDDYTAYLCSIPGRILADLYLKYGGRLLEGNVRSFLSVKGKINKGIRNTIQNQPVMFFAYNNGIAATAYSVKVEYGEVCPYITEITSLQIVNGGQTTASLAAALAAGKADGIRDIFVPMKLSVVTPEKAEELIPNIAKYANSQNKVSEADFFSNHAFHVRVEAISRKLTAPAVMGNQYGTYWYYERTRGQYKQEQAQMTKSEKKAFLMKHPKSQMFTKTDLAKYYNSYRQLPHLVCAGAQKNFIKFAEWASESWEKDQRVFNNIFFQRIVCLNILFKKTDILVKRAPWYEMGYKAQVVTYTLAYLFYAIEKQTPAKVMNFKRIWNEQNISGEVERQLAEIAENMYNHLISPRRGLENVTEWAKREACWQRAKEVKISLSDQFKSTLVSVEEEKARNRKAAKKQQEANNMSDWFKVAEFGADYWKKLYKWGTENHILNAKDISLIKSAISMESGGCPSEKQSIAILKILEKARIEGFPD